MPHSPTPDTPPVVLTLGGNDPTGGAGLAADIQTLSSLGCHPAPVITAVTAQDTHGVKQFAEKTVSPISQPPSASMDILAGVKRKREGGWLEDSQRALIAYIGENSSLPQIIVRYESVAKL